MCVQVAFAELEPFPSRSQLQNRSQPHQERFMGEWREREKMKTNTKPVIQVCSLCSTSLYQTNEEGICFFNHLINLCGISYVGPNKAVSLTQQFHY